jgi:hypothetical protein
MGLLDRITGAFTPKILNLDIKKPRRSGITQKLKQFQLFKRHQDIQRWQRALEDAKSITNPNRTELIRTLEDVRMDTQVDSVIRTVNNKILLSKFTVVDGEGNIDDELLNRIDNKVFANITKYALEAQYWGYSVIELDSIKNDFFADAWLIPREHVVPEYNAVKVTAFSAYRSYDMISLDDPKIAKWHLMVKGDDCFGMLNDIVPNVLFKKVALAAYSEYTELFGNPTRVIKVDHFDDEEIEDAVNFLAEMGRSAYGVFKKDQEFEMHGDNRADAYQVFTEMVNYNDSQIAKVFLGSNFIKDDGGSRARDSVLMDLLDDHIAAYKKFVMWFWNDQLVPLMQMHGIWKEDRKIKFVDEEVLSIEQKTELLATLLQHYSIEPDVIAEKVGIEVGEKELGAEQQDAIDQLRNINDLYSED